MLISTSNDYVKHIKKLQTKKSYRYEQQAFVVEGIKMINDGIGLLDTVIISEKFDMEQITISPEIEKILVSDKVFRHLSDTVSPQGIMGIVKMPCDTLHDFSNSLLLFCDGVSDPGNLGTIIRSADAAGADGVILGQGCADIYNSKTIRSTMSSIFHIKTFFAEDSIKTLQYFQNKGTAVIGSSLSAKDNFYEADYTRPTLFIVGNEANGISDQALTICDKCVKIPMLGRAESLNVAVAASVMLFEAVRQRN